MLWHFAPMISGGVYRPHALCRYADVEQFDVTVLAGPMPEEHSDAGRYLLGQLPRHLDVRRAPLGPTWAQPHTGTTLPALDGGFESVIARYEAAVDALKDSPPALVFASGPRFAAFVTAYLLAARFGSKLLLEYRDEWTECPFSFVRAGEFDRRWERRCLRRADHVIFTTESQRQHQLAVFPELTPERCSVIPNGWEPTDLGVSKAVPAPVAGASRKTISFVGNLGNHTLPASLLNALEEVLDGRADLRASLTFEFIGEKSRLALESLQCFTHQETIRLIDQIPKPAAMDAMRRADSLMLINSPDFERYIPGKLYDYLAMRRPLFVYGAGGEIERLVSSHRAGFIVPAGDAASLESALDAIAFGPTVEPAIPDEWLAAHTRESLAMKTWGLMASLLR